ncbi:MAG: copper amine oxidase N-terminal domain-containing protein, partial [Proteobacteria bacterium]|nr:copper amine oxidase N-terminal domain-containing protein [Pseudomonadota bacterium]
ITGTTSSFGENNSLLVVKLNSEGSVVWTKTFTDVADYNRTCAVETKSGEIVIVATSSSEDVFFLKLDVKGNILVQKTYGGDRKDWPTQIVQTSDGGFIIAGNTTSFSEGQGQGLILKIDASGSVKWATTLSEVNTEDQVLACESGDNGIVVACSTTTIGAGGTDILVLKLNSSGSLSWARTFGGAYEDVATSIASASGTDCVVAGYTSSLGVGGDDCLVMRINSSGGVVWSNTYGTGYNEEWYGMTKASDGGFVVAGCTLGGDAKYDDVFLAKLNTGGTVQWAETFRGDNDDYANAVTQAADSGFVTVGITKSFASFDQENYDFLVIKTDSSGGISGSSKYLFSCNLQAAIAKLATSTASIKSTSVSVDAAKSSSEDSIPKLLSATICGGSQTIVTLQIDNPKMKVNGTEKAIDEQGTKPIIKNNRTLVPIRAIIESLGGTIAWDATAKKVTLALGSTTMQLWIGSSTAKVNDKDIPIDKDDPRVVPEIINSRTMIPLRFVAENLGCDVLWEGSTQTITIKYPKS